MLFRSNSAQYGLASSPRSSGFQSVMKRVTFRGGSDTMRSELSESHCLITHGGSRGNSPSATQSVQLGGSPIMTLVSATRIVRISAVLFTLTMLMATPALAH